MKEMHSGKSGQPGLKSYKDVLDFLYNQLPFYQRDGSAGYKIDLGKTRILDDLFNHPSGSFRSIHIAGTNGKGSVAHMMAAVLMKAGLKVGLYTSPHLTDFRERIKINGHKVPENYVFNYVVAYVDKNFQSHPGSFQNLKPSFFELTVFMAFTWFRQEKIDVAVIETGLGGRLDTTNIITPDLTIITNIGYDHQMYLGNKLTQIAGEKAGIIKQGVPVVISETQSEIENIFIRTAHTLKAPITFADQQYSIAYALMTMDGKQKFTVVHSKDQHKMEFRTDLMGNYQGKNILAVLQGVEELRKLKYTVPGEAVVQGLENAGSVTGLRGRWQVLKQNPLVVCDTGHNVEGIREVVAQIKHTPCKNLHIVLGFANDKDLAPILGLFPQEAVYYFVQAAIPRALEADKLAKEALRAGLCGKVYPSVKEAYKRALSVAADEDMIFVGGSTFVVAEIF